MSAYMVDREHVDALVALALRGPSGRAVSPDTAWYGVTWRNAEGEWTRSDHADADALGRMLWTENLRSIHYRYPDTIDGENIPGPADFTEAEVFAYTWPMRTPRLSALDGLGAVDCYEYQACEHPEWAESEAFRFCQALRRALIGALPGYRWPTFERISA